MGDAADTSSGQPTSEVAPADRSGLATYMDQCALCHGQGAEGTEAGPQLRHPVVDYAKWVIRHGREDSGMPAFSTDQVTERQLGEIFAWLVSFERPTAGQQIYEVYCGHCHGADGRGGAVGQDVQHEAGNAAEFFEYVRNGAGGNDFASRYDYMPRWSDREVTDSDIQLIVDYLIRL